MILFWFWLILYNPQSPFKISANDSVSTIVLWVTNKLGGYYLGSYLLAGPEEGGKRALILTKNYANMPCTRESQRLHVGFMSSPALRYMRDLCGLWECVWTVFGFSFLMPDWCPTMSNCFSSDDAKFLFFQHRWRVPSRCKSQHWSGKLRLSVAEVAAGVVAFCGHFMSFPELHRFHSRQMSSGCGGGEKVGRFGRHADSGRHSDSGPPGRIIPYRSYTNLLQTLRDPKSGIISNKSWTFIIWISNITSFHPSFRSFQQQFSPIPCFVFHLSQP